VTTRTAHSALRESVAAMSDRQIALAAREIGVSKATLAAYAEGRSSLPEHSLQRLGAHVFTGRFFIKREEARA
jgi:hypothetical protein